MKNVTRSLYTTTHLVNNISSVARRRRVGRGERGRALRRRKLSRRVGRLASG
jgi:hypothetical protein